MTTTGTLLDRPGFSERFAEFMRAAQAKVDKDYAGWSRSGSFSSQAGPKLEAMIGGRYVRLVSVNGQRSAFGFVDRQTGGVLKCAGWKGPAKNFARGNIFNADLGCSRISWTGVH